MKGNDQVAPHLFSNLLGTSLEQEGKNFSLVTRCSKKIKTFKVCQHVPRHEIIFVKSDALGISVPQQLN